MKRRMARLTLISFAAAVTAARPDAGRAQAPQSPPASETVAAPEAPRPIALSQALELAQLNAPQAIRARGQTRVSEAAVRSNYAAFIPNLSFSMGAGRPLPANTVTRRNPQTGAIETIPSGWSYSNTLGASVDLFDGGRRLYDIRQARANVLSAEANETAQTFDVALNVKQQYFNVLAARESAVAARSQLDQAEQQYRAAVARVRAGSGTKSDSLRSEIQLSNARVAVLQAANDLEIGNAALTRAVGVPYTVTAMDSVGPEPATLPLDDQTLYQMAGAGPAVVQADANLRAAHATRQANQTTYLPTVSASYNYGGSGTSNLGFQDYNGQLRFSLSFPIFDQFGRADRVLGARVAETNAEADLRDARLAAQENLTRYLGAFRTAGQQVLAQQLSVAAAEEDLRVQQQRYNVGASTLLDVLTSQSTLNQARQSLIRARYDQRVARAQLEALIGRNL